MGRRRRFARSGVSCVCERGAPGLGSGSGGVAAGPRTRGLATVCDSSGEVGLTVVASAASISPLASARANVTVCPTAPTISSFSAEVSTARICASSSCSRCRSPTNSSSILAASESEDSVGEICASLACSASRNSSAF